MRRIAILAMPPAQLLDIVGPAEVFARCEDYRVELYSTDSSSQLAGSSGLLLGKARHYRSLRGHVDTLLVAGGPGAREPVVDRHLVKWLKSMSQRVRRIGSVCTGAFLLAEAGILSKRRVVTHWRSCRELAQRFPDAKVEEDPIFIKDGHVYTSAGITAGMDLALGLVEEDHGHAKANEIARHLVMFLRRPGGQSQFSSLLAVQTSTRRPFEDLHTWILKNLTGDLSVEALAGACRMSSRHFARLFPQEKGITPGRYVEQVRVEAARVLLSDQGLALKVVAGRCGFSSPALMRRAFTRVLGVTAREYASRFSS